MIWYYDLLSCEFQAETLRRDDWEGYSKMSHLFFYTSKGGFILINKWLNLLVDVTPRLGWTTYIGLCSFLCLHVYNFSHVIFYNHVIFCINQYGCYNLSIMLFLYPSNGCYNLSIDLLLREEIQQRYSYPDKLNYLKDISRMIAPIQLRKILC